MYKVLILFGNPLDFPVVSEQLDVKFEELSEDYRSNFFGVLGRFLPYVPDYDFSAVVCVCPTQHHVSNELINHSLGVTKHFAGIIEFDVEISGNIDELQNLISEKAVELIAESPLAKVDVKDLKLNEESILKACADNVVVTDNTFFGDNSCRFIPRDQRIPLNSNCPRRNFVLQRKILRRGKSVQFLSRFF